MLAIRLNTRLFIIVAFNALLLFAMISVLSNQQQNLPVHIPDFQPAVDYHSPEVVKPKSAKPELLEPPENHSSNDSNDSKSTTQKSTPKKDRSKFFLQTEEHDSYTFKLSAAVPSSGCSNSSNPVKNKQLIGELATEVTTSILFGFSPLVDKQVRKMFSNDVLREKWFELHPFQVACLPVSKETEIYCALRIWLRMDRFAGKDMSIVRNRFQDSFMYAFKLDRQLNFVKGSGDLLGIPTPVQDVAFTGPEDPRVFSVNGSTYVNFIMAHSYDNIKYALRRQFVWGVDNSVFYSVQVNRFVLNDWEKNWTPWIIGDTLHFVYQFTPVLRVMRCRIQEPQVSRSVDCSFIAGQPPYGTLSGTNGMLIRGGSAVVSYTEPNYYVAVTHTVQGYEGGRLYAAQVVLLNGLSMRIVMVSSPIFIDMNKMRFIENLSGPTIKLPFVYARSVLVENEDSFLIALGVNDNLCYLVRLKGVAALLKEAISQDKKLEVRDSGSPSCGSKETEMQREQRLAQVYEQMNDWLRNKNLAETESRFTVPPTTTSPHQPV